MTAAQAMQHCASENFSRGVTSTSSTSSRATSSRHSRRRSRASTSHRAKRRHLTYNGALVQSLWVRLQRSSIDLVASGVVNVRRFFALTRAVLVDSPPSSSSCGFGIGADFVWLNLHKSEGGAAGRGERPPLQRWAWRKLKDLRRREVDLVDFMRNEKVRAELEEHLPRDLALEILDFEGESSASTHYAHAKAAAVPLAAPYAAASPAAPTASASRPEVNEEAPTPTPVACGTPATARSHQMRIWTTDVITCDQLRLADVDKHCLS